MKIVTRTFGLKELEELYYTARASQPGTDLEWKIGYLAAKALLGMIWPTEPRGDEKPPPIPSDPNLAGISICGIPIVVDEAIPTNEIWLIAVDKAGG